MQGIKVTLYVAYISLLKVTAMPYCSVGSVQAWKTEGRRFNQSPSQPIFFRRIENSHRDRINSILKTVHGFNNERQ